MTHLTIEKRACIALLYHIKNSWGWSQTDTHLWQFFNTAITSIQAYSSLSYLFPLRIVEYRIGVLTPQCTLGIASLGMYVLGLHRRFEASRLYGPYERVLQVVNLICCIFFFRVSDSPILWKIAALLLQVIDLTHSFHCGTMHQRIREATNFVMREICGNKNTNSSDAKPYYHLLAIANVHIDDVYGSEFRSNLISMIQQADKDANYAKELTEWTIALEKEQDVEKIRKDLATAAFEFSHKRKNVSNIGTNSGPG